MKIMLVNSPWVNTDDCYGVKAGARWAHLRPRRKTLPYYPFPFAMAYATSVLKAAGFDTIMLDAVASGMTVEETLESIQKEAPEVLVLETSTPSIEADLKFAVAVDKQQSLSLVYSGPHATALPEEVLNSGPGIAVLRGEYDYTLLDLVKTLETSGDLSHVEGIHWRDGDTIRGNPNRPLIESLDDLPWPERQSLPMPKYTDPSCKKFPNVSLISSRGCPHSCIFCLESTVFFHTPSFRNRDPEKVVDEMESVIADYGAQEIYFDDSSFTTSRKHARAVSQAIINRGLKVAWSCMADARVDFETLKLMRDSGCIGLKFGVETADPVTMGKIKKNLDLNYVDEFGENCRKLGLHTHGTFMFGLPGETRESIRRTIEFAFNLKCTTSQFSVATPFPGTEFYEMAKKEGWLVTDDWSKFDGAESPVIAYPDCSTEDILAGLEKAKKRKIIRVITNPVILTQYMWKLYKMKGFGGLLEEIAGKAGYLLERDK